MSLTDAECDAAYWQDRYRRAVEEAKKIAAERDKAEAKLAEMQDYAEAYDDEVRMQMRAILEGE